MSNDRNDLGYGPSEIPIVPDGHCRRCLTKPSNGVLVSVAPSVVRDTCGDCAGRDPTPATSARFGGLRLTARQAAILAFVVRYRDQHGFAPTMREIGRPFGIASTNGVEDHLLALARKGYISRAKGTQRSIVVLRLPDGALTKWSPVASGACPTCKRAR